MWTSFVSGHFFAILASKWQAEAAASKRLAASNSGNQQLYQLFDSRLGSLPGSILQRTGTWHCKQLRYFVDSVGKNVMWLTWLCALWIAYVLYWSLLIFQQHFAVTFLTMVDSSRREWNQRCVRATATRELRGRSVKHSALSWQPPWVLLQQLVWRPSEIQMKPLQPSKACQRRGKTYTSGCIIWSTHLIYSFIIIYKKYHKKLSSARAVSGAEIRTRQLQAFKARVWGMAHATKMDQDALIFANVLNRRYRRQSKCELRMLLIFFVQMF